MPHKLYLKIFPPNTSTLSNPALAGRIGLVFLGMNGLGIALAHLWSFDRVIFNLDYLLVGLVYVWLSRSVAAVLAMILFLLDVALMIIPIFFFSREAFSVFFWLRSAIHWALSAQMIVILGAVALLLLIVGLFRRYRLTWMNRITATVWIFGLFVLLVTADWLNGSSNTLGSQASHFDVNIAGSSARYIIDISRQSLTGMPAKFAPLRPEQSATGRYFSKLLAASPTRSELENDPARLPVAAGREPLPDKLVVVVVESLSVLKADADLENWRRPFEHLGDRYTLQSGILDWRGATLRGELRELCWQSLDGMHIQSPPTALPTVLKNLQYETCSFHGFHAGMYDRARLYPLLGFDHNLFLEDMQKNDPHPVPVAGTLFRGATDSYVAALVRKEVLLPGKRMIYWMTLSGHIPVNRTLARDLATPEEQVQAQALPAEIWAHNIICRHTLQDIAAIAGEPSLRNCDFIIVGDHQVPFTSTKLRSYYRPQAVPYLILRHIEPTPENSLPTGKTTP